MVSGPGLYQGSVGFGVVDALVRGEPGAQGTIQIRGANTFSADGNTPLYVVDGVFVDNTATSAGINVVTSALANGSPTSNQDNPSSRIADLRPEDIDNIEILKGASAAAIYGSKAAAGARAMPVI